MGRLGIVFISIAIVISFFLTILLYQYKKHKTPNNEAQLTTVNILVATRNISPGISLKDADLSWKPWPRHAVSPLFFIEGTRNKEDVVGAIARQSISVNQPITDALFISKENLSPLTGLLKPGMRAFSIEVNLAGAIGGLIAPGDLVDVILAYSETKDNGDKATYSRTILQGVRVLAVDTEITPATTVSTAKGMTRGNANSKNVTLEVTPQQAEVLAMSKTKGTLSLSLTSPVDTVVTQPAVIEKQIKPIPPVILIHGDKIEKLTSEGS